MAAHDPPNRQEIRLTWLQVLRRQFFDTPLPLPSGTGVQSEPRHHPERQPADRRPAGAEPCASGGAMADTPHTPLPPENVQGPFTPHRVKVGDVIDSGVADMITKRTLAALAPAWLVVGVAAVGASACTPTVSSRWLRSPSTATLSADVRIRLDKELQTLLQENPPVLMGKIQQMTFRKILVLGAAVAMLGVAATGAMAQTSAQKAMIDAAKTQGTVGEQADGYVGVRTTADADLRAAIDATNTGRRQVYERSAAEARHHCGRRRPARMFETQLLGRISTGQWYKNAAGQWVQR
jgi:uncharacterized protein YdbL (DUF1318 family)